jgi:hypothetical protein
MSACLLLALALSTSQAWTCFPLSRTSLSTSFRFFAASSILAPKFKFSFLPSILLRQKKFFLAYSVFSS